MNFIKVKDKFDQIIYLNKYSIDCLIKKNYNEYKLITSGQTRIILDKDQAEVILKLGEEK